MRDAAADALQRLGNVVVPPPPVPAQGVGPHFELDPVGGIYFAPPEALDQDGNNVALLRSLHPPLRDLARSRRHSPAATRATSSRCASRATER